MIETSLRCFLSGLKRKDKYEKIKRKLRKEKIRIKREGKKIIRVRYSIKMVPPGFEPGTLTT